MYQQPLSECHPSRSRRPPRFVRCWTHRLATRADAASTSRCGAHSARRSARQEGFLSAATLNPERTSARALAHTPASPKPPRERLLSLDVFRGMTIAGMLLVNNPGSWGAIYPPLAHAPWHGWTPTDLIFPFFLFIVGITTHLSLQSRRARGDDNPALVRQILRRGALIFLAGLLLNGFPFLSWGSIEGVTNPSFLDRVVDRP